MNPLSDKFHALASAQTGGFFISEAQAEGAPSRRPKCSQWVHRGESGVTGVNFKGAVR